jgi:hypothetical protein
MDDLKASDIFSVDGAPEIGKSPDEDADVTYVTADAENSGEQPVHEKQAESEEPEEQESPQHKPVQELPAPADTKEINQQEKTDEQTAGRTPRRSHPLFYMFSGAILVMLIVMAALFLRGNQTKEEIDLSGYIVFDAQGNDGAGTVNASLDEDRFVRDYDRKIQINRDRYLKQGFSQSDLESKSPALVLARYIEGSLKTEAGQGKLMNGDTAAALVTADVDVLSDVYNVMLKGTEIPYVVSGLNKLTSFDPFEGVRISYSGVSPDASAEIVKSGTAAADSIPMKLSKTSGITKGDRITVTLDVDDPVSYCVRNLGKTPLRTSMTVTADGADTWLTDAGQLSGADLSEIKSDAAQAVLREIREDTGDESLSADIRYEGYYLFSGSSSADTKNVLYLILQVKADENLAGDDLTDGTWYACVAYKNVEVTKDGIRYPEGTAEGDNLFVTAAGSDKRTAHVVGYRTALQVRKEMLLKESSDYTVTTDFDLSL